jgi:transposase-like protein
MNCPKCKSGSNVKNGIIKGVQRYKCKDCGFNYTVEYKSTAKRPDIRRFGLMLYLEGLGFHSIGRLENTDKLPPYFQMFYVIVTG